MEFCLPMVIEPNDASVTIAAVLGSRRPQHVAR